jgi:hypothetical protein
MAAVFLYGATGAGLLWAWNRYVQPLSRAAAIVLILLPLLFTGRALLTGRAYSPADLVFLHPPFEAYAHDYGVESPRNGMLGDIAWQIVPWQQAVRDAWRHGEWPLWNPAMLCGDVLMAAMQPAVFDPFNLLALFLPLYLATTYAASLTLFIAALAAFALARQIGATERGALVAAAGYALSAGIAFNAGWPLGRAWALVPFLLCAVSRVMRDSDLGSAVLLTLALVLLITAGHPETLAHAVSAGVVWGLFELRKGWLRGIGLACAAGAVALLLTAIVLLPFLSVLRYSEEYQTRAAIASSGNQLTKREVRNDVLATVLPFHGGASWHSLTNDWMFGWGRAGSVVLALAIAGISRRRMPLMLALLALLALAVAWNSSLLRAIPILNIAANYRYSILAALCISLLAAVGFDQLRGARVIVAVAVALTLATAISWSWEQRLGVDTKWLVACALAEIGGLAIAAFAVRLDARVAVAIVIGAICVQRAVEDGGLYPAISERTFYPAVPLVSAIARDPLYRVTGVGSHLAPNVATMYGLDDVRGYEAMTFAPLVETYPLWCRPGAPANSVDDLSRPFLNFLGVRYALAPSTTPPPEGWRVVRDDRGSRLLANTRALPRVFAPAKVEVVANVGEAMAAMMSATDFADTAWLYTRDVSAHVQPNGAATLQVQRSGSRYEVDATMRSGGWVVVAESAWPGWRAYVDGRRVKTIPVNVAFFGVYVPAGRHHVRIAYLPDAFVRGRVISFATIALLIVGFCMKRWR